MERRAICRSNTLGRVGFVVAVAFVFAGCGRFSDFSPPPTVPGPPDVQHGLQLMQQHGCLGCHTLDGGKSSGPTLLGVAGRQVSLDDGTTVIADDDYLRRSIMFPDSQIVQGFYGGFMSVSINQRRPFTDQETNDVVAYLKTLQ